MPAYLIGTIRISDTTLWRDYVGRVGATFAQYGGEVLGRVRSREDGCQPELQHREQPASYARVLLRSNANG